MLKTRGLGWVAGREWKLHVLLLAGREWKLLILLHRFVDKPLALHNFLLLPASPPHTPHTHTRRYLHPPQTGVAASGHLRERLWIRLGLRYGPCRRSHRFLVPLPCTDPHVPRRKGGRRKTPHSSIRSSETEKPYVNALLCRICTCITCTHVHAYWCGMLCLVSRTRVFTVCGKDLPACHWLSTEVHTLHH